MNEACKELWVDKYRPTTLDDYVLNADLKQYFREMVKNKSLQNFTMIGCQGMGKTTLAKVLCNEFDAEVLFVKCATEGSIDTLRAKVEPFCNAMSVEGRLKIVVLDEVDSASSAGESNFQKGLRTLIEAAQSDTRFILTANYNKIIPAVLSRCPIIPLKFDQRDLLLRVKYILDNEKVTYDKESLKAFIEEAFKFYPDVRRIINYLQFCCNSNSLVVKLNSIANSEKESFISMIVNKSLSSSSLLDVRKLYIQEKKKLEDFVEGGSLLFNYVADNALVTSEGILKLTDQLYYLNVVVDKEPIFFGMLVTISKHGIRS